MIKCSKGNVEIKGDLMLLKAETIMILKGIRNILEEEYGKKHAEESMKTIFEVSTMTQEEMKAKAEEMIQEIAGKIAEHLVK